MKTMKKLLFVLLLVGCKPVDIKTAPGFLQLKEEGSYAYRATTPVHVFSNSPTS